MRKIILIAFCVLFFEFIEAKTTTLVKDSAKNRIHLHLAVSFKPIFNWITAIDSNGSFLNSRTLYETQISYKKHYIFFGINVNNSTKPYTINGISCEFVKLYYSLNPGYNYLFFAKKRWQAMAGIFFMYNVSFAEDRQYTSLETLTETTKTIDRGLMPSLRLNYRFNKLLSIETEFAYYFVKSEFSYIKNYPLTPSLQVKSEYRYHRYQGGVPSNLLFKITF